MPLDAKCPKCSYLFPVTEARHAFTVACPRCEAELTAEFKKPATKPEPGQPPYELFVKSGALAGTNMMPAAKKKKDEEDDDDKSRGGGSTLIVLLSGGLGLLFVLGGLTLTGWFLFTQVDTEPAKVSRPSDSNSNNGGTKTPVKPKIPVRR